MSDKKPTSKKQDTPPQSKPKQAPTGKVKGQGEVSRAEEKTANLAKGYDGGADKVKAAEGFGAAYEAGRRASETGAPGRPPAEYSDVEVRAWFEGYKSHANPNAEGQVEGVEKGYRSKY